MSIGTGILGNIWAKGDTAVSFKDSMAKISNNLEEFESTKLKNYTLYFV